MNGDDVFHKINRLHCEKVTHHLFWLFSLKRCNPIVSETLLHIILFNSVLSCLWYIFHRTATFNCHYLLRQVYYNWLTTAAENLQLAIFLFLWGFKGYFTQI